MDRRNYTAFFAFVKGVPDPRKACLVHTSRQGDKDAARRAPSIMVSSLSQPRHSVFQPGSRSLRLPWKPPSWATPRQNLRTVIWLGDTFSLAARMRTMSGSATVVAGTSGLRAYPKSPAARKVIQAQAK